MRVLVTGANGFVGSYVAEALAAQGVELRLALRRNANLEFLGGVSGYERVDWDLRDPESLRRAVAGMDAVAHVAGVTTAMNEAEYQAVNAGGTAALAQATGEAGVKRFVYVSSLAAQGTSPDGKSPPPEPHPVSTYGRSKLAGEAPVLAERERMSVAIVRPSVVYGPRDRALLPVYRACRLGFVPVYGDGSNQISWIHARDCADAIARVTLAHGPSGGIYPLSDGTPYTWRDLLGAYGTASGRKVTVLPIPEPLFEAVGYGVSYLALGYSKLTGRPSHLSPKEIEHLKLRYWICDNQAIGRDLGWQPQIDIVSGLRETLAWYKQQRWL